MTEMFSCHQDTNLEFRKENELEKRNGYYQHKKTVTGLMEDKIFLPGREL